MNGNSRDDLIYQQDCEFVREFNRLRWSRLRTLALVESGLLYVFYKLDVDIGEKLFLLIIGSILVLVLSPLPFIDQKYHDSYVDRIRNYEGKVIFKPHPLLGFLKGRHLMLATVFALNLFNVYLFISLICSPK